MTSVAELRQHFTSISSFIGHKTWKLTQKQVLKPHRLVPENVIHGNCGFYGLTIAVNKVDTLRRFRQKRSFTRAVDTIFVPPSYCCFYSIIFVNILENRKDDNFEIRFGLMDCQRTICVLRWIMDVIGVLNTQCKVLRDKFFWSRWMNTRIICLTLAR